MTPALLGLALAACGASIGQRRMSPRLAVRLLTTIAVSVALAVAAAASLLASGVVADAGLGRWLTWCQGTVPIHDAIPTPATVGGAALLGAMAFGAWRFARRSRQAASRWGRAENLEVVDLDGSVAYLVPGPFGHVAVSTGLLRLLSAQERRALFEHERAHLRLRRSRYLRWGGLSAAAVPLLRPVGEEVRRAAERWADEIAADVVGDRGVVASAIAQAASASAPDRGVGFDDSDVVGRVQALLAPRLSRVSRWWSTSGLLLVTAACLIAMAAQTRGLIQYGLHICGAG